MKKNCSMLLMLLACSQAFGQNEIRKTISVPVIFHVIYSDRNHSNRSDGGNTSENVETTRLLAELKDLHQDFLLLNKDTSAVHPDFKNVIGNPEVNFFLADTILQSNGEKGIIRINSRRNKRNLYKRSAIVNPQRFLNIYVGNVGSSYVMSQSWRNPVADAVFLGFDWIGKDYRLLSHETGHWFGLSHIYGGSGRARGGDCSDEDDDDISDTPPQKNATDIPCEKCPPVVNDQSCIAGKVSNYNNFMDYSGCRKMFTIEQSKRMREIISAHRAALIKN